MKKIKYRKSFMVCIILCIIILVIVLLNNIPVRAIFPIRHEQDTTSKLRIMIDKGDQDSYILSFKVEGEYVKQIEELLSNTRLSFCGMYNGIEYGTYEGDWIIRISSVSSDEDVIYIRGNGEVYSEKLKFTSSGDVIKELYDMILSWVE